VQSDSPPDTGTTPDSRSLTDLWRDLGTRGDAWHADRSRADLGRPYFATLSQFYDRLAAIAGQRNQATIREHAQVEHPHQAWDAQAAVFTTGRFAEGRAR
jgi:hypothetical protein